jgi:hypothetical protein
MLKLLSPVLILLTAIPAFAKTPDHCANQLQEALNRHFQTEVKIISLTPSITSRTSFTLWARTDQCNGYIAMRFQGRMDTCGQTFIGKVPHFAADMWATGGCVESGEI